MKKKGYIFIGVVITILLAGHFIGSFSQQVYLSMLTKQIPEEILVIRDNIFEGIKEHDAEQIFDNAATFIVEDSSSRESLEKLLNMVESDLTLGDYAGYYYNFDKTNSTQTTTHTITHEVTSQNKHYLMYMIINAELNKIVALNIMPVEEYLGLLDQLKSGDLNVPTVAILLIGLGSMIFALYTAGFAFGVKRKHRVLWTIFALAGIGYFGFNTLTGGVLFWPLTARLPLFLIKKAEYGNPMMISYYLPIPAVLFWLRLRTESLLKYKTKSFEQWYKHQFKNTIMRDITHMKWFITDEDRSVVLKCVYSSDNALEKTVRVPFYLVKGKNQDALGCTRALLNRMLKMDIGKPLLNGCKMEMILDEKSEIILEPVIHLEETTAY